MAIGGANTHLDSLDLSDPGLYAGDFPHALFDELRRRAPVFRSVRPDGSSFWALTRHGDAALVARSARSFTSTRGSVFPRTAGELERGRDLLVQNDPPRHSRLRALVQQGFSPRMIGLLTDGIRERSARIVRRLEDRGQVNFVSEVSAVLPAEVTADILGVAAEDRAEVGRWVQGVWGRDDPAVGGGEASRSAWDAFEEYLAGLREHKRGHPADDIATLLADAAVDGERLTDNEYRSLFVELTVAGFETTNSLIAQGMRVLLTQPDALATLRREPAAIPTAVEEMLRFCSPFVHLARTATEDVEVGGQAIAAGEIVTVWLPAVNRDPAVFEEPHVFRSDRDPNPHVAFNPGGHHYCLGAHLARLEARVLFEELLLRGPELSLAGEPTHLRSTMVQALTHLPVAVRPRR